MSKVSSIKISLRCDDLSNWNALNPVLNNGELAIVNDSGRLKFKIGNGTSTFSQLPFFNENEVTTATLSAQDIIASSISQGLKAKATPLGFAAGAFLSANANFSLALGFNAETLSDDSYAFVWNGDAERALLDYYLSHGKGTFSINPTNGLNGFYVGERSLSSILSNYCTDNSATLISKNLISRMSSLSNSLSDYYLKSETSSKTLLDDAIGLIDEKLSTKLEQNDLSDYAKVWISTPELQHYSNLSVVKLSYDDYSTLASEDKALSNAIYIVSSDMFDNYGQRIINVDEPVESADAATKNYVDLKLQAGRLSTVEDESGQHVQADMRCMSGLSIVNIDLPSYATLLSTSAASKDTLYLIEQEHLNAFGLKVINIADGTDKNDAVTVGQLDEKASASKLDEVAADLDAKIKGKADVGSLNTVSADIKTCIKKSDITTRPLSGSSVDIAEIAGITLFAPAMPNNMLSGVPFFTPRNNITVVNTGSEVNTYYVYHGDNTMEASTSGGKSYDNVIAVTYTPDELKISNTAFKITVFPYADGLTLYNYAQCFLVDSTVMTRSGIKRAGDVSYADELLVWDFDTSKLAYAKPAWIKKVLKGSYYWVNKCSSGKTVLTTGTKAGHRFFSIADNAFIYNTDCIGKSVYTIDGPEMLVSAELQDKQCEYVNIMTDRHINCFVDGILCGCSIENGLYSICDMKFIKDKRFVRDYSEFSSKVPKWWFDAFRYSESTLDRDYLTRYYEDKMCLMKDK